MPFYSQEYKHLLIAEQVLAKALEAGGGKLSEQSQCARALVDVVQMKRFIRGRGNPRPTDAQATGKRRSFSRSTGPIDPTPNTVANTVASEPKQS